MDTEKLSKLIVNREELKDIPVPEAEEVMREEIREADIQANILMQWV